MEQYIGLDVSLKETHICVVDGSGAVLARSREVTQPELLARAIMGVSPSPSLVVVETGAQSSWLHRALTGQGLPVVIVDARRAKAALSCRLNKTDANDAEGLAQLARTGWYREVLAKRPETRLARSLLLARQQLAMQRRDLENQVRVAARVRPGGGWSGPLAV
jgi:transposase